MTGFQTFSAQQIYAAHRILAKDVEAIAEYLGFAESRFSNLQVEQIIKFVKEAKQHGKTINQFIASLKSAQAEQAEQPQQEVTPDFGGDQPAVSTESALAKVHLQSRQDALLAGVGAQLQEFKDFGKGKQLVVELLNGDRVPASELEQAILDNAKASLAAAAKGFNSFLSRDGGKLQFMTADTQPLTLTDAIQAHLDRNNLKLAALPADQTVDVQSLPAAAL
jgi:hypothetical protein